MGTELPLQNECGNPVPMEIDYRSDTDWQKSYNLTVAGQASEPCNQCRPFNQFPLGLFAQFCVLFCRYFRHFSLLFFATWICMVDAKKSIQFSSVHPLVQGVDWLSASFAAWHFPGGPVGLPAR